MAANVIGHATLNVVPSTKGFGSALKGDLNPLGQSGGKQLGGAVGGAFRSAIGPLMAAAGIVGMGAFVGSSIKAAGALEQSMGAIDSVFKANSGQMHAWAKGAAMNVGLTANEFNELGTLIGSQLKNAGTAMTDLAPKTNELIGLGADLASMFGGTSKEAVEAISSALKGERDPIERYGVSLKQTAIDAKAAELGFQKVGGALSAEANAAATLALIMEQTTDAHGNFARESSTYEGTMQRLSASWGNITATIGQGFLPIATAVGTVLLGMMPGVQGLADRFAALAPAVQGVIEILLKGNYDGGLFAAFDGIAEDSPIIGFLFDVRNGVLDLFSAFQAGSPDGIAEVFTGLINGAASMRDGVIAAVLGALPGIVGTILAMAPSILQAAITSFQGLVQGLITAVPPLLAALLAMVPQIITLLLGMVPVLITAGLQLFMGLVQAVVQVIPQIGLALVTMLPQIAASLLAMLPSIIEAGLALFMGLVEAVIQLVPVLLTTVLELLPVLVETILGMLPGILTAGIELFLGLVTAIIQALPQIITTLVGMLPRFVTTLVGMIPTLLSTGIELFITLAKAVVQALPQIVGAIVTQVIPALVGAVIDAVPQLLQAGIDLIGGLVQGLWNAAGQVGSALLDIIGGAVDGFLDFLGIHSPSRLFRSFGGHIGDGLALGIADMEGDVASAALGLANAASDAVDGTTLSLDAGIAAHTAAALAELGVGEAAPHYETTYNDYSTSQEDKQAKLQRAQLNLERTVAATLGR